MKVGAFYQSGHKLVACYKALEQLRKIYPEIPVALYEDGSEILQPVAKRFNTAYKKTDVTGLNLAHSGRPITDLRSNLAWLKRIYESTTTVLKDVDWIIHYEDDVWCMRKIKNTPIFDIAGANGPLYTKELYGHLKGKFNVSDNSRGHWSLTGSLESYGACGGAIFNREAFIKAYEQVDKIPWEAIRKLDTRPLEWSDASLSFIMQYAGYTSGVWNEWANYKSVGGNWFDKTGWTTPMDQQPDAAFLHLYKHFYNYKPGDIELDLSN